MITRFAPLLLLCGALALTVWLFASGEDEPSGTSETPTTEERSKDRPARRTSTLPARAAAETPAKSERRPGAAETMAAASEDVAAKRLTAAEKAAAKAAKETELVRKARRITAEERKRGADLAEAARGAPAPEAREEVKRGLLDDSEYVRLQALQALTRFKADGARDIHEHLLVERSEKVQEACVHLLGRHGDESMIEELGSWASGKPTDLLKAVDKARRKLSQRHDLERPERLAPRRKR